MTAVRDQILSHNSSVEWAPEWTGTKRMGEWLSNIKDWAISREVLGTPIPVWICPDCGAEHCVGSIEEMNSMSTEDSPTPQELHRPYVDDVKLVCTNKECSGEMVREPYVMDCGSFWMCFVRTVALSIRERRIVRRIVSSRLHLRGRRSD